MTSQPAPSNVPSSDIDNECWNERSERRTTVLQELKAVLKDKLGREQVPPAFWAFCQVSDISKLEEMVLIAKDAPSAKLAELYLEPTIDDCDSAVDRWLQNLSASKSTSSGTDRSNTASCNCKRRDNYKCVLTGGKEPESAHIYPHCLIKASGREPRAVSRFWNILRFFWEGYRVDRWQKEIFSDPQNLKSPHNGCFNMISLDKHPHALWGAGRFALRPMHISTDGKALKVKFHWQSKPSHKASDEIDLLTEPATSRGLYEYDGTGFPIRTGTYLVNALPEYRPIVSGDVFTLTTTDPKKLPLPSWPLLEMQWHLQRIAGMSGVAEPREDFGGDDDDDAKEVTAVDRDAVVRRVRTVSEWLQRLPENEQSALHPRPPISAQQSAQLPNCQS